MAIRETGKISYDTCAEQSSKKLEKKILLSIYTHTHIYNMFNIYYIQIETDTERNNDREAETGRDRETGLF